MPQLDTYRQQQTAQNELRVVRNAQPSAAASEVVGETITAAGELGIRIQQARAEQEAANLEIEAGRRYDSLYRELEQDGEGDAAEFEKRLTDGSAKLRGELLGKVKSKPVRDAFDLRLKGMESGYVLRTRDLARRRSVEEIKGGLVGRLASLEDTANDLSVLYEDKDNPEARTFTRERAVVLAEIRGMREKGFIGKDDEATYREKIDTLGRKADSDRVLSEIDTRLDRGEAAAAEEFFKLNYGRVLPEQRERVESALETKGLEVKAVQTADKLWSDAKGDYGAFIAKASKIENVDERLAVEARGAQLKNQGDAATQAADQAALDAGMEFITTGRSIPAAVMRDASPKVRDLLQTEQRTRQMWAQQMSTLSAQEKAAIKEASAVSKDYFKGLAAYDPVTYVGGPMEWPEEVKQDWNRLMPEHQSEILADIQARRAAGGTVNEADKVLKELVNQIPVIAPENRKGVNFEAGSGGKAGARKLTEEEKVVRASLYRQSQEYARRTGGAAITPQDSKVMIARAFREADPKRYPYPEPGAFTGQITSGMLQNPAARETRAYLQEKLGRAPTDQEVIAMLQAAGQ